jgi:hypothetical protein
MCSSLLPFRWHTSALLFQGAMLKYESLYCTAPCVKKKRPAVHAGPYLLNNPIVEQVKPNRIVNPTF